MYIYIGVRKFFSRDKSSFFVRSVYFFPIILIASFFFFFSYPNIVKFFFFTHVLSFEGMFECFPFQKHVVRLKFKTSITNDSMNSFLLWLSDLAVSRYLPRYVKDVKIMEIPRALPLWTKKIV